MLRLENPDRLEHGEFGNALTHRLRHRVAGQQYQGEEYCRHDRTDDQADIAKLFDEGQIERFLGLGLGFVIRVRRQRIDGSGNFFGLVRTAYAHYVPADGASAKRTAFIKIIPAKQ